MTRRLFAALLMAGFMIGTAQAGDVDPNAALQAAVQRAVQGFADRNRQELIGAATKAQPPGVWNVLYPPHTHLFLELVSATVWDGTNHLVLFINTTNFDMYAVVLTPEGTPLPSAQRPFLYGTFGGITQTAPTSYRIQWTVYGSIGGLSGPFLLTDGFVIEITI